MAYGEAGRSIIENPNLDAMRCYKILSYFFNLAHQVINSPENFMLVANTLSRQVEEHDASLDNTKCYAKQ
jgi:hypothetical protein